MILAYSKLNLRMEFIENTVNVLVLEDPVQFSEIVYLLKSDEKVLESPFVLSESDKFLQISKEMEIIVDPFSLDFNSRKIQQQLYKEMEIVATEFDVEKAEVNGRMLYLIEGIQERLQYQNIAYNLEFSWENLLKLYQVHFEPLCESLLEKLVEYIKIASNLLNLKVIGFVNLKLYLTKEQLHYLYEIAFYNKVNLLLIENIENTQLEEEKLYIVDRDKCIIVKKKYIVMMLGENI